MVSIEELNCGNVHHMQKASAHSIQTFSDLRGRQHAGELRVPAIFITMQYLVLAVG